MELISIQTSFKPRIQTSFGCLPLMEWFVEDSRFHEKQIKREIRFFKNMYDIIRELPGQLELVWTDAKRK